MKPLRVTRAALLLWTVPLASIASQSARSALTPPNVQVEQRWSHFFTHISSIRELSDGSMLVVDAKDRTLFALPSSTAPARSLGRQGAGPGEYRYPVMLAALRGDSTILVDGGNRRWMLLTGTTFGELRGNLRSHADLLGVDVAGLDAKGNALRIISFAAPGSPEAMINDPALADSMLATVISRDGTVDSVARLRHTSNGRRMARVPGESDPFSLPSLLSSRDQAVLFLDGTVAVARTNPYRVEWRSPNGQWSRSVAPPEKPVPVTADILRRLVRNFKQRPDGSAFFRVDDFPPWPKHLPPFRPSALIAGHDGNLYVRRTRIDAETPSRVDAFDRRGTRVAMLELPTGARLVGTGARGLYLAQSTPDGEEMLIRASWR